MEAALITFWQTFASSFGKLCVLPLEWFYVRFTEEEEVEGWVAAWIESILGLIPCTCISEAIALISLAYDIITLPLPTDPLYCAECLRVIGG